MEDFFISYNQTDKEFAQRIADWLDQACFTTILQANNFVAGSNFVSEIHTALERAQRIILVLSPAYLTARFPEAEWTGAFAKDPTNEKRTLIPVRVRECEPGGLLRPIVYIDLVGLVVEKAKAKFLAEIQAMLKGKRVSKTRPDAGANPKPQCSKLSQSVTGNQNTAIQAEHINNIILKTSRKTPPSIQPLDAIGASIEMKAYVEYLIGRYIDLRKQGISSGKDRRPFKPPMIHQAVKRDFGARINLVPQSRFPDLVKWLQHKIDDTIEGKLRRSYGNHNYHTFAEHSAKLHGKPEGGEAGPHD